MKNLKQILIVPISLIVLIGAFFFFQSFAVNDDDGEDKKVKIKMIKVVNGVETIIDTTIIVPEGGNIQEILNGLHIADANCNIDSLLQTISLNIDLDENGEEKIVKMCVSLDGEDGIINIDSLLNSMDIDISDDESGEMKIITTTIGGDCGTKSKTMKKVIITGDEGEIIHSDENIKMIKTEEGIIKVVVNDEGKKTITITNDSNDENEEEVIVYKIGDGKHSIMVKTMICKLSEEESKDLKDIGIETAKNENLLNVEQLGFYPNPNNGKFNLKFQVENKGETQVKIFDISGKEVYGETIKNFKGNYDNNIDISSKGKGTYFLNISQDGKVNNTKIIIQ